MSTWKPSQAQEIEFEGLRARRPLYIAPYVLAGFSRNNDLNDAETAYVRTTCRNSSSGSTSSTG